MPQRLTKAHFVADDGEHIHFVEKGSGTPLLMLHGWTADHQEWQFFLDALARHHRVVLWDARGHGSHAPQSATKPGVQRMARDLQQLLDRLALADVALVGHSMGALTAWEYVAQFGTERLAKLCLIDQSPKLVTDDTWQLGVYGDFDARRSAQFVSAMHEDFAEAMLRLCAYGLNQKARAGYDRDAKGWQGERQRLRKQDPRPLIETWESLLAADYREVLPKIDVPTFLLYGAESNFYLRETGDYVRDRIPQAALHVYEGTDHSPHLWEVKRFTADLLAFIAK